VGGGGGGGGGRLSRLSRWPSSASSSARPPQPRGSLAEGLLGNGNGDGDGHGHGDGGGDGGDGVGGGRPSGMGPGGGKQTRSWSTVWDGADGGTGDTMLHPMQDWQLEDSTPRRGGGGGGGDDDDDGGGFGFGIGGATGSFVMHASSSSSGTVRGPGEHSVFQVRTSAACVCHRKRDALGVRARACAHVRAERSVRAVCA
jgi:hypothetical protein